MGKLAELFKLHDLGTIKEMKSTISVTSERDQILELYSPFVEIYSETNCKDRYASIWCGRNRRSKEDAGCNEFHSLWKNFDGTWIYGWAGGSYLTSKKLLPFDVLHELNDLKKAELEEARKKRFEKVKSPRDAVRIIFRDLEIKHKMVGGDPRIDCGPFNLEFRADKKSPKVDVVIVYHTSNYVNVLPVISLTLADPFFNNKIEAIIANGTNLVKLLTGEVQPKPV